MNRRGSGGGEGGHGAASGASSGRRRQRGLDGEGEAEGKLRIHLKRSCTDRKVEQQGSADLGLTTDDWQKFKRLLATKTFTAHDTQRIKGEGLTAEWAKESGFREPVIVPDKAGMGLAVPDSSFTVADVSRIVGEDKQIRPIHVGEQANIDQSMSLAEFAEYFETCTKPGQAILNMISLEFSDTPLSELVQSPQLVRDMDWINRCWPDNRKQLGEFPKVQYYCLMSQGGSYTDFHVDFGGTSVWYHVLRGKKEFLLIRPTQSNLDLYEDWIRSPTQSQVFFGDLADICYRVMLNAGETLMIPSGWIHAVFTPKPSLVFGGNFLHSLNIPMQLQVHAIETRAKIQNKFRFPYFKEMMFFAASWYVRTLRKKQGDLSTLDDEAQLRGEGDDGIEGAERANAGAVGSDAGYSLSSWEREGLPPLLEACEQWLAEEGEGDGEGKGKGKGERGISEKWVAAATVAGCSDVGEMLHELGLRVAALDQNEPKEDVMARLGDKSAAKSGGAEQVLTNGDGDVDGPRAVGSSNGGNDDHGEEGKDNTEETNEKVRNNQDPSHVAKGSPSTAKAKAPPSQTTVIPVRSGEGMSSSMSVESGGGEEGTRGPVGSMDREEAPAGLTIPKLKISIKPPSLRASKAEETGVGRIEEEKATGAGAGAGATGAAGRVGKSRSPGSLKLVLKRPTALTSAASSLSSLKTAGGIGGKSGADGDGLGQKRSRRPTEKARWKQEEEEDFKSVFGSSSSSNEDDDDSDVGGGDGGGAAAKKEDEEEWTGESRVGRGGKKRAGPLGSRLKAIARLGDNAAAGDSADDSADEYKPEDDEMLTEDHNVKLDDEDVRETKKARASAQRSTKESANTSSGLAGGEGAQAGSRGNGGSQGIGIGRHLSVTKQEALRSKGLFKIAPQSKVPVQQGKKEKKPLTAKQKLLAKMRR